MCNQVAPTVPHLAAVIDRSSVDTECRCVPEFFNRRGSSLQNHRRAAGVKKGVIKCCCNGDASSCRGHDEEEPTPHQRREHHENECAANACHEEGNPAAPARIEHDGHDDKTAPADMPHNGCCARL